MAGSPPLLKISCSSGILVPGSHVSSLPCDRTRWGLGWIAGRSQLDIVRNEDTTSPRDLCSYILLASLVAFV
jgi:hypothetical protein